MRGKVSKRTVDAMKPKLENDFLWDRELRGFGCKVTPSGRKTFVVQYLAPGKHRETHRLTIGTYGPLTADDARDIATLRLAEVTRGNDPASEKAEARRASKEDTVARLFTDYMEYGKAHWGEHTLELYELEARLYMLPALGRLPVAKVTTRDIAKVHLSLKAKPATANKTILIVKAFFFWLERNGLFTGTNPAKSIELFPEAPRERFLSVAEMARLGQALRVAETIGLAPAPEHAPELAKQKGKRAATPDKKKARGVKRARNAGMFESKVEPANPVAVAALRFLSLSGWREQEALTLQWDFVNLSAGTATLPDTKTGKSIRAIPAPALELLAAQPRVLDCPYIFPGRNGKEPLREVRRLWYAARHEAGLKGVRLHDLRHSVASFAGGQGYSLFLIGKLLGHKDIRSTQRYAHLADDIRKTMADSVGEAIRAAMDGDPAASERVVTVTDIRTRKAGR